jgi:hypothetical protein
MTTIHQSFNTSLTLAMLLSAIVASTTVGTYAQSSPPYWANIKEGPPQKNKPLCNGDVFVEYRSMDTRRLKTGYLNFNTQAQTKQYYLTNTIIEHADSCRYTNVLVKEGGLWDFLEYQFLRFPAPGTLAFMTSLSEVDTTFLSMQYYTNVVRDGNGDLIIVPYTINFKVQ